MCQCCRVPVLPCCSVAASTSIKQLTNPRQLKPLNVAAKCIIGLLFFFFSRFFFYFFFVLFALPLPAISRASLHSDSLPDGSGNWLRAPPAAAPHLWALFACPTLVAPLSLSLGFSLKSSSSSACLGFCHLWSVSRLSTGCDSSLFLPARRDLHFFCSVFFW